MTRSEMVVKLDDPGNQATSNVRAFPKWEIQSQPGLQADHNPRPLVEIPHSDAKTGDCDPRRAYLGDRVASYFGKALP